MKHGNNFDFLRFLFSFLVVMGHTIILSEKPEFRNEFLASMPNYSVLCFFIISGYLIYSSYERLGNLRQYFINRAKRIIPAYFFVVLFFAFFLFLFSSASVSDYFSSQWFKYLGSNLFFLNFLQPCINSIFNTIHTCAVNGSLWTIKVELSFYIFVPFLVFFVRKMTLFQKNTVYILLYLLSTLFFYLMTSQGQTLIAKQLPGSLNYFIAGILLYVNRDFFHKNIYLFLFPAIIIFYLEKTVFLQNVFSPFALGIVIFWFAFLKIPLKNFGKYGDFSYGMYLVHFPIIQIFAQEGLYEKYSYLAFLMSTLIVIVFSILIWNFVEKPILKRKSTQIPVQ